MCERLTVLSKKLCVVVRDPQCKPKISITQRKTHGHGYHLDFELGDRNRGGLGISYPLALALGVGQLTRARYIVLLVPPVMIVTLDIGMCEGVDE